MGGARQGLKTRGRGVRGVGGGGGGGDGGGVSA